MMNIRKKLQILALVAGISLGSISKVKADWLSDQNKIRLGKVLDYSKVALLGYAPWSLVKDLRNIRDGESNGNINDSSFLDFINNPSLEWDHFLALLKSNKVLQAYIALGGIALLQKLYNYFVLEKLKAKKQGEELGLFALRKQLGFKDRRLRADRVKVVNRRYNANDRIFANHFGSPQRQTWLDDRGEAQGEIVRIDREINSNHNRQRRVYDKLSSVGDQKYDIYRLIQ